MRIIFHIDVNSAYLSWTAVEQLKNGAKVDIRTIPAIIGGDQKSRHGIVLAKSIPAKKYGIRTGEPVANAFRKCPNLKSYPPDHQMYREYSRRLMDFLRTYTTHIEQVSVDECYMDFTEIADRFTSPVEGANEIKDEVYKRFGFTVNVGISSRKVLSKMASDFEKPNKVHTLFPEEVPVKMWPLPIGELFMAGRSSVETMKKLEIYTIGDLEIWLQAWVNGCEKPGRKPEWSVWRSSITLLIRCPIRCRWRKHRTRIRIFTGALLNYSVNCGTENLSDFLESGRLNYRKKANRSS